MAVAITAPVALTHLRQACRFEGPRSLLAQLHDVGEPTMAVISKQLHRSQCNIGKMRVNAEQYVCILHGWLYDTRGYAHVLQLLIRSPTTSLKCISHVWAFNE